MLLDIRGREYDDMNHGNVFGAFLGTLTSHDV
jgi:hypothetical protein